MATSSAILRLYENVLQYEIGANHVSKKDIKAGVRSMAHAYAPNISDFQSRDTTFPNFNDPACRCAYLHKFAPLHTYIVQDVMMQILKAVPDRFHELLVSNSSRFKICSLGGGPGSDVIGVVTALLFDFGPFHSSVTIVDCMKKWKNTVALIMHELTVRPFATNYSNIWSYNNNCQWNYIECNLLNSMTNDVNKSIAAASMITMVKFVSAAVCTETENMVDKIFRVMKPGALVLFIDNAAGGFTQMIERSGKRNGLEPIFGPLRHVEYESEALQIERFGYTSCFRTTVTIILMQKLQNHQQNWGNLNSLPNITGQNATFGILSDLSSNRGKIDNTVNPRPSEVAKKSPAAGMPQKPVSSLTVGQNGIGINSKSMSSTVRPSVVSNVTDDWPTLFESCLQPSAKANATGLSVKGMTGQNATSVPSNRGKIENTVNPRPSEVAKESPAAGMPQKPVSSLTVGQNGIGINSKSMSSTVRPSVVSNVTDDWPTLIESCLQPNAKANATGLSAKGMTGQNATSVPSNRGKIENTVNPRPSEVAKKSPAAGMPQKPVSSLTVGQNGIGINSKSMSSTVRPSVVSNVTDDWPTLIESCLQPNAKANATGLSAKGMTGQNATSVPSNRGKIENTVNPRPSEVAKKSPAAGMPQKPVSSLTVGQNGIGINSKSMSSTVRLSVVSNVTDDWPTLFDSCLQPSAKANATGLSAKGMTGQNATSVPSNRGKIDNTVNPRPSEVAKKSPAAGMPQKPVSSLTVGQNGIGINSKSMSSTVRPSVVSNVTDDWPTLFESCLQPSAKSNATGLSAKGMTGQNATSVPSNRGKIENTVNPRPSEVAKKSPAAGMPQKPVSSLTVGQNGIGINSKSMSSTVRPSVVCNVTDDWPTLFESFLQPSAKATAQIKSTVPNSANPENRFSNANQFRTPQLDSGKGSKRNSSGVPVQQQRAIAVVPPESPTKYRSPNGDRSLRPKSRPSPIFRTYHPVAGDQNRRDQRPKSGPSPTVTTYQPVARGQYRRDQRLVDVDDSPEETGCSCCSIS